jgi:hypothetical protein
MVKPQALILILALLLSVTAAAAHPNQSCHSHGNTTRHCK